MTHVPPTMAATLVFADALLRGTAEVATLVEPSPWVIVTVLEGESK